MSGSFGTNSLKGTANVGSPMHACQNGDLTRRLPNTTSIRFVGADADAVMVNMEPVAVSTGSACSSGSVEPSGVLLAMGFDRDAAFESIRFSLGRFTTPEDIEVAVQKIVTAVSYVRMMTQGEAIDAAR